MDREKIEQQVIVSDQAQTGDITLIGKIVYIVKHPSAWQEAIWGFLSKNRGFLVVGIALEATLAGVYLQFRNLYLIPLWRWGLAVLLLIAAAWGWYTWGWLGRTKPKLVLTLLVTSSLGGMVGWQAWQIVFPDRFDPQVFGIAIAELGEGPDFQLTEKAREISGQVYEHLCEAIKRELAGGANEDPCKATDKSSEPRRVELMRIGVIPDSQTARAYGERIRADVVIWGQLLTSKEGGVTVRFQVIETPDRAVNPEFPLVLPVVTTSTDILASELNLENDPVKLKEVVAQQSTIISSFTLGLIAYLDRDFPQAVIQFESAAQAMGTPSLEISPEGGSLLYFYLGRANNAMGRFVEGQDWLRRAQDANPQEPAVPLSLALGHGSLGEDEERDADLRLALDLVNTWLEIHPNDNAATYDRGIIYQIRDQYQYAVLDYESVTERDPDYYIAYISLGQVASDLGAFEQAEDSLRTAIALAERTGTNSSWAHLNLALVYAEANEPELAKAEYLEAIALAPDADWMHFYYARFLESRQEMDAALLAYRELTDVTRDKWNSGWAYGSLAGFLKRRGLLEEALENYQRAVRAQPEDGLLHTYLADTYFRLNDVDNALREFEEGIRLAGSNYYVYASYGVALFELGNYKRAAQMFERSLELRPIDSEVLLNLGQTYEELGQSEKAKEIYVRILRLSDQFPEERVRAARDRLQALLEAQNP